MKNKAVIAFDVGGTTIKTAVIKTDGEMVPDTFHVYESMADRPKEALLSYFLQLIEQQIIRCSEHNLQVQGVGYGFPGPFDYERGISYIRNIDKYDSLYGVNLKNNITERIHQRGGFGENISKDFCVLFENDASMFALGESVYGQAKASTKAMFVTLGTGAGSAFIENRKIIKQSAGIPENGWIFNQPFYESMIDDYISKRGILRIAKQSNIFTDDVVDIARKAESGNDKAKKVFQQFGDLLAEAIAPYILSFQPDALVLGGQITKSYHWFGHNLVKSLERLLNKSCPQILTSQDTSKSALLGSYQLVSQEMG